MLPNCFHTFINRTSDIIVTIFNPQEGGKLLVIINRFKGIIATSNLDLGSTDIIKHTIDVQGNPPIRMRTYRPPFKQKEEIDRQVQETLDHGIIRPSESPRAAPVVLV